ncbi:hypothetical protein L227DRAFT_581982 [Lentinus tigrinus ALCF2SS1-6]|uniref:Secreted protein n=1 Tax=Lentinus tigrinus ALCF2SS1-6 TaxID=1328759 RepID=A0A5C2RM96_9APHY|nr:hypothetical protein L227DRAFT_581982 [Lentinus tigrinus ALCF2SS1-6]
MTWYRRCTALEFWGFFFLVSDVLRLDDAQMTSEFLSHSPSNRPLPALHHRSSSCYTSCALFPANRVLSPILRLPHVQCSAP